MYSTTKIIKTISLIALTLGCFGLSPQARAVDPPPDGGYANQNTAEGEDALFSLTDGFYNTALGFHALHSMTGGHWNTATGYNALFSLGIGDADTATGSNALYSNTSGTSNTAMGSDALFSNTTGRSNTAIGSAALSANVKGHENTASGVQALYFNTSGTRNVANGLNALHDNTTGSNNIALGAYAGSALTTGSNNIDVGNNGVIGESGIIRIGTAGTQTATFIAGIRETPLVHGVAVAVGITPDGQLGVKASSARFKEAIKPMEKESEAIFSLQPVTFRYKKAFDPQALPQFGLVAEQVAKVSPDLVARDVEGKPFTVRYDEVNAMLLNEFLKEHRKGEQQDRKIEELEATVSQLQSAFKEQAAQIQKVSDQLGAKDPVPRVVAND